MPAGSLPGIALPGINKINIPQPFPEDIQRPNEDIY